jgi:hypothetical protein
MTVLDTARKATPMWQAIAESPAASTVVCEISAHYWARFLDYPLLAINLLNPLWWPERV